MEQKYLPIGSVCTLKGKNKKVMITGYYAVEFNGNLKIRDYCGCVYPEGLLLPEQNCIFNHTDIETIDFVGFKNDEYQTFKGLLNRLTNNGMTDEEKAMQFHEENDMFLTSNSTYSKLLFDENGVVMIADPIVENIKEEKKDEFDENGTVIHSPNENEIKNPFYKEYNESKVEENNDLKIFNKIEFDENGTVVDVNYDFEEKKQTLLNKIEFDENGTVISVNGDTLKEEYEFDENGTLIAVGTEKLEDDVPPIGPGLPGYVEPKQESKYEFDENGTVIAAEVEEKKQTLLNKIEFDENGTVISVNGDTLKEEYEFDENGTLIAVGTEKLEDDVPPIGPGLPGYVAPQAPVQASPVIEQTVTSTVNGFQFDAQGNVIAEPQPVQSAPQTQPLTNIQFDENGTVVSA